MQEIIASSRRISVWRYAPANEPVVLRARLENSDYQMNKRGLTNLALGIQRSRIVAPADPFKAPD
jgi:hypothetical protein